MYRDIGRRGRECDHASLMALRGVFHLQIISEQIANRQFEVCDCICAFEDSGSGCAEPDTNCLLENSLDFGTCCITSLNRNRDRSRNVPELRPRVEKFSEMSEKKLAELTWDQSGVKITAEDLDWDYVKMLPDMLPKLRNEFAHGSTELNTGLCGRSRLSARLSISFISRPLDVFSGL